MNTVAIGRCKDCANWHEAIGATNWNTCEYPDTVEYDQKIGDEDFALYADADDDSGSSSGMKTGPMFGCIKFRQRVAKPTHL